jgi:hypothetical protein
MTTEIRFSRNGSPSLHTMLTLPSRLRLQPLIHDVCCLGNPHPNVPIHVIDGDQEPVVTGIRARYTSPGGTRLCHPATIARIGVYATDTREITVGRQWIARQLTEMIAEL